MATKGLNNVQLIGRLGKDPEMSFTPSGAGTTKFSLAINESWKKDGETHQRTEWINIETWGRLAEICNQYLRKGSLIYIEGRIRTDKYDKDGQTKYYTKVVGQKMIMLGDTKGNGNGDGQSNESEYDGDPIEEDDIPF